MKFCFLFLNINNLFNLDENILTINRSFDKQNKDSFLSPELLNINSIPSEVNYKCIFYSLASLIAFCIEGKK